MNLIILLSIILETWQVLTEDIPSCNSKIFCQGNLLHTVQMAKLYEDSKHFVDLKLKNNEEKTLEMFDKFLKKTNNNPTKSEIQQFVNENFEDGNELEDWTPGDYTEKPELLARITNTEYKNFAQDLVKVWPKLAKKIKQQVLENPDLYSLIPVSNGFIIPGGRFKEFYYWDSYWIVKGLLLSDMQDTVKGMLDNFLSIVEKYGFIPNGARIYYLNRSQPPLLNLMAQAYMDATNDIAWLKANIQTLDKELRYWIDNKLTKVRKNGIDYMLAHYDSESGSPRPESYFEDFNTAAGLDEVRQKEIWKDLKSGAESGWDFSSRWLIDENGGNQGNLKNIQTRRIIPVDLNAILVQAYKILGDFYDQLNDMENTRFWFLQAHDLQRNIEIVLYDRKDGIWYDYDSVLEQPRKFFYPSNFAPLWTGAYEMIDASYGQRAAAYFKKQHLEDFQGGIPTSLENSNEQWDLPNAWPPLQSMVILGLRNSGDADAAAIAEEFAKRWIQANIIGFNQTNEMFEKYDATQPGQYGGGGEYTVQSGFGWTNGVAFEIIDTFFTRV